MSAEVLDDDLLGVFELPAEAAHPAAIAARLIRDEPEHRHLADVSFLWLMRNTEHLQGGKRILAMVHKPEVQGKLKPLFEQMLVEKYGYFPDYLITVDKEYWDTANDHCKTALVWHELAHVKPAVDKFGDPRFNVQTGEPIFQLVMHDIEEFNSVVRRFGLWKSDLKAFIDAANEAPTIPNVLHVEQEK